MEGEEEEEEEELEGEEGEDGRGRMRLSVLGVYAIRCVCESLCERREEQLVPASHIRKKPEA